MNKSVYPKRGLAVKVQNIVNVDVDVLVISANPSLLAGSGISGIIHRIAGPELEKEVKHLGPLKAGQSAITSAFNLRAKYVIHTVCPHYMDGLRGEHDELAKAYASAFAFYGQLTDVTSIAFVLMGTGVYKWPIDLAADIAVNAMLTSTFDETLMCVMDEKTRLLYQAALDRYL